MRQYLDFYIDGQWLRPESCPVVAVENPATERAVGEISFGNAHYVDLAVAAAEKAFSDFAITTASQRRDMLRSVLDGILNQRQVLAEAITAEMGAPTKLAETLHVQLLIDHLASVIDVLGEFRFIENLGQTHIRKEPIGVCGLITPWNWPLNQVAAKLAPALAAGCTVVLKPSENAPFSAYVLAEIIHRAGLPKGVFNLVNGDGLSVGAALSEHPRVDLMSFTGSTRAGRDVMQKSAGTVKKVALELGGKSACIVLDDADLTRAVQSCALTVFRNTGQTCTSQSRLLVPRQLQSQATEIAVQLAEGLVVGDPQQADSDMGPLASQKQYETVQHYIQQGIREGAVLSAGGPGKPAGLEVGYFAKPTVFSDVTPEMVIANEEIFGPVLTILPYDTEEEALTVANNSIYGLSGAVHSSDPQRCRDVAAQLRTGMVHINGVLKPIEAPFGGYKQSGLGREGGRAGIKEFLETKAIFGY